MNRIYQTYYRLQKSIIYPSYVRVSVFHLNFNNVVEQSKLHPCVYVLRGASRLGTPEIVLSTPWNISALAKPFERNPFKRQFHLPTIHFQVLQKLSVSGDKYFSFCPRVPSISRVESTGSRKYGPTSELEARGDDSGSKIRPGKNLPGSRIWIYLCMNLLVKLYIYICV